MSRHPGLDLVERARALAPLIVREADEIERTRRLTPAVTQALIENGLYRALLPKSFGGTEAPLEAFMQMQEEVAKADASTAWCLGQCSVCAMTAAYLDPDAANEIFNVAPGILAWGAINHEVQAVPGGYKASARWDFASGSRQAKLARRPCPRRRGRRHAAAQAGWLAGDPHHPVSGDQRHDVRRLGRDRAARHRHRFLFGRQSLHPREICRASRRARRRGARTGRCTSSPPTWCSAWALRQPRSASPAPRSMPRSTLPAPRRRRRKRRCARTMPCRA